MKLCEQMGRRYDGHNGTECAEYLKRNMHKHILHHFEQDVDAVAYKPRVEASEQIDAQIATLTQLKECKEQIKALGAVGRHTCFCLPACLPACCHLCWCSGLGLDLGLGLGLGHCSPGICRKQQQNASPLMM